MPITKQLNFKNCNCNIYLKGLTFDNTSALISTWCDEFQCKSLLNIINCPNVYLEDIICSGKNYTTTEITGGNWYYPYLYKEQSTLSTLYNDIFVYNSNININKIKIYNSAIGIYATTNSNVSIDGDLKFYNTDRSKINLRKRQVVTFATRNSKVNIKTGRLINYSSTNLYYNDTPVYDTDELSGTYNTNTLNNGQRSLRINSVPIIYGLTDIGSIFNHNHVKIQPNVDMTFTNLSGNLPNGAIYFQTISGTATDFNTVHTKWDFNIKRNEVLSGNNNNKISRLTDQPDTYGLMLTGNTYNQTEYSDLYNIYKFVNTLSGIGEFDLPVIPVSSTNSRVVIPVIKNFEIYGVINSKEYKLNI